jgi:hypothetical protein
MAWPHVNTAFEHFEVSAFMHRLPLLLPLCLLAAADCHITTGHEVNARAQCLRAVTLLLECVIAERPKIAGTRHYNCALAAELSVLELADIYARQR